MDEQEKAFIFAAVERKVKEDEKQALKEMADKYNMTLTDFIKNACNEYAKILDKQEK